MIFVVGSRNAGKAQAILDRMKEPWYRIGQLVDAKRGAKQRVVYR
jgi:hypothetical protein